VPVIDISDVDAVQAVELDNHRVSERAINFFAS
jgi:hypothetical protein